MKRYDFSASFEQAYKINGDSDETGEAVQKKKKNIPIVSKN